MTTTTDVKERKNALRRSGRRWVWARRTVQAATLIAALGLFFATARQVTGTTVADPFFLVDPLIAGASMLAARMVLPRLLWSLGLVGVTLVVGRAWCGWACPMGTTFDALGHGSARSTAPGLRRLKYLLLVAVLAAALLGSLVLLVLDPLTLFTRSLGAALLPALNWAVTGLETVLYPVRILRAPLTALDSLLRGPILPYRQGYFPALLFGGIFVGVVALNWVAPRFWCRVLCPLGAALGLISRISWLRRKVNEDACTACGRCAKVCPTGTIDPARGYASDPAECTLCLNCLAACPSGAQAFKGSWGLAPGQAYDPGRRRLVLAAGAGLLGVGLARVSSNPAHPQPDLLRPPGAHDPEFLARCARCGRCIKACPTAGLQPALGQAGLEGFWTPVLVPRLGYCNYSCTACGQVCPTGAIPHLSLEEKRRQVIGKAYIDRNRCIPWADDRNCIVCEEVCPLPDKAVVLDDVEVTDAQGGTLTVRRPRVIRNRCIGCGLCESKCPLNSQAAIQVRVDDPTTGLVG